MKKFLKVTAVTAAFLMVGALPKLNACSASACCNEACSIEVSCTGTNSCHADGNAGTVTCDGAKATCGSGGGSSQ